MFNAQEWLIESLNKSEEVQNRLKKNPSFKSVDIAQRVAQLDISRQSLTGSLDLRDFVNLEKLNCSSGEGHDLEQLFFDILNIRS